MIRHLWTGWNGAVVDLTPSGPSPIRLLRKGVEGLGWVAEDEHTSKSAAIDGQVYTGGRLAPREVFWPVAVGGPDGDWFEAQAAFWDSLRPGVYGTWRVIAPNDSYRELRCRFSPKPETYEGDPSTSPAPEIVDVELVADDPWWRGPLIERTFQPDEAPTNAFLPPGSNGVLYLTSGFLAGHATIDNPGQVPAWPVWTVRGPVAGFTLGVGTAVIAATFGLGDGEVLIIDTDPRVQAAVDADGVLVPFSSFSRVEFAEVGPGDQKALVVEIQGAGTVTASLSPRYFRAW